MARKKSIGNDIGRGKYTKNGVLRKKFYKAEFARLREELVKLQYWIKDQGL